MLKLIQAALDSAWNAFPEKVELQGPTERTGFLVKQVNPTYMVLELSQSTLNVPRDVFEKGLEYLVQHHGDGSSCKIQSDQNNPGPLSEMMSVGRTRTFTYVLRILQHMGFVTIDPSIPSTVRLATA